MQQVDRLALLSANEDITLESVAISMIYERETTTTTSRCEIIQSSISEAGFNESVGVTCDASVYVKAHTSNLQLKLELQYSFPNVPFEEQSRLFERFYRVEKSRNREFGGSGLGLSL